MQWVGWLLKTPILFNNEIFSYLIIEKLSVWMAALFLTARWRLSDEVPPVVLYSAHADSVAPWREEDTPDRSFTEGTWCAGGWMCVGMLAGGWAVVLQLAHLASHYISAHVEKPPEGKTEGERGGKKKSARTNDWVVWIRLTASTYHVCGVWSKCEEKWGGLMQPLITLSLTIKHE